MKFSQKSRSYKLVSLYATAFAAVLLLLFSACTAKKTQDSGGEDQSADSKAVQTPQAGGNFALGGSTTVDPIAQLAIEGFTSANPTYQLSYNGVGSSNGIKGVLEGSYVLGGSSRELESSEIDAGVQKVMIARDGMAVVTHNSAGVEDLSKSQISDIFTGVVTNWSEVGGVNAPIVVLIREESSGTRASFDELALDNQVPVSSALVVVSNGDMVLKLNTTPNSIGYIGLGYIHQLEPSATPVLVDGYLATQQDILAGNYPLVRPLYIVYTGELDGFKKFFINYLLGPKGQDFVAESGFLPIR